jgi:hypothetical protein
MLFLFDGWQSYDIRKVPDWLSRLSIGRSCLVMETSLVGVVVDETLLTLADDLPPLVLENRA